MPKDLDSIFDTLSTQAVDQKLKELDGEGLSDIGALCKKLVETKEQKQLHEKAAEEATQEIQNLSATIGTYLKEKNLTSLKLTDGSLVEYDEKLRANIKRENTHKAYEFIRSLGAGDLIKNEIKMQFGKGQDEDAEKFREFLISKGLLPQEKQGVAWNTLDAWCRETIEQYARDGKTFPEELFGIFRFHNVKIKNK